MNSEEMTAGSLSASATERKWHSARSRWWNSTGGGSASSPTPGNTVSSKTGPGINNIKAGDGGVKFRAEWPDEDKENWEWIQGNRIDPRTGKAIPDPEGEAVHYGAEAAKLRRILGAGGGSNTVGGLGQAAREAGQGWLGRWKWWLLGGFVTYLLVSRVILGDDQGDS